MQRSGSTRRCRGSARIARRRTRTTSSTCGQPATTVDLSGYTLGDVASPDRHVFSPASYLAPGAAIVVYDRGDHADVPNAVNASTSSLSLNNSSETVTLRDTTGATVRLSRVGTVAASAAAEITPTQVLAGTRTDFLYSVVPVVNPGDSGVREIEIDVPGGFTGVTVTVTIAVSVPPLPSSTV